MIEISEAAAIHLLALVAEKAPGTPKGLRLAVEKGGCAGLQYAMALDDPKPDDHVAERNGARIFVDPESAAFLQGCLVDYEDGLTGSGFRIVNPNATRSCGCGTSFEPGKAQE